MKKTVTEYKCPRCGFVYFDSPENHAFHKTPHHEVRVNEEYIGNGEYRSIPIASTEIYAKN